MRQKMKNGFRQIKNNLCYIGRCALVRTCSIIAFIQILGFLCEFNDGFPDDWRFLTRLLVSAILVGFIWLIMFVIKSIRILCQERVIVFKTKNGHHVYVEYGDIFEESDTERITIVTANRCFDTIVDNDLISENTIHGIAVKKICESGITAEKLNKKLQDDIQKRCHVYPTETLTKIDKRKGNLKRYPVGTIAEFGQLNSDKKVYAFLGMSTFNADLHPETTDMEYVQSLQSVIEYCKNRSNKCPVYIPIIGTHGRNNPKSERELLQYMVEMFRFNKHLINTEIHIVVYSGRKNEVSIFGL